MSARIRLGTGMKLVLHVIFLKGGVLFVSVFGPVSITFSTLWPSRPSEIVNASGDLWQFSVHAGRGGPLSSEMPVTVVHQAETGAVFHIGDPADPEALLIGDIFPAG